MYIMVGSSLVVKIFQRKIMESANVAEEPGFSVGWAIECLLAVFETGKNSGHGLLWKFISKDLRIFI